MSLLWLNNSKIEGGEKALMTILKRLTLLVLVGLLTTACSGTTVKNSWVKPGYADKIENVYLVGIAKEEDFRRLFEEAFKRKLTGQGVRAIASHNDLAKSEERDRESIVREMTANNCDSVLLTRMIRKQKEKGTKGKGIEVVQVVPVAGPVYIDPWYNSWGSYYYQGTGVKEVQPITHATTTLTIESVLYDLKTEERIWSAQLDTVKEIDVLKMIQNHVDAVVRNLKQNGLI
jgi:hypothetical protein